MTLQELNSAGEGVAQEALSACCGSESWVQQMLANLPVTSPSALHQTAADIWWSLTPNDWLQAFSKHPKIGGRAPDKWSAQEQNGMSQVNEAMAGGMRELNEQYVRTFGWIFIVCATGKSAEEMRALLEQRLKNGAETELRIAAAEQIKITHIRLEKLMAQ